MNNIFSDHEVACFHCVRYSLNSHRSLDDDDVSFCSDVVTTGYSNDGSVTVNHVIALCVLADERTLCSSAVTINEDLERSIRNRDPAEIMKILRSPFDLLPEFFGEDSSCDIGAMTDLVITYHLLYQEILRMIHEGERIRIFGQDRRPSRVIHFFDGNRFEMDREALCILLRSEREPMNPHTNERFGEGILESLRERLKIR